MSEYWRITIGEILGDHDIHATSEQLDSIAYDLAGAASVEGDYSPPASYPDDPSIALKAKVARLEDYIRRLGARFNIGTDPDAMSIHYYVPCGSAHIASHEEHLS